LSDVTVQLVGQKPRGHITDLIGNPPAGIHYRISETPGDLRNDKPVMSQRSLASRIGRSSVANTLGIFLPAVKFMEIDRVLFGLNVRLPRFITSRPNFTIR
jgi:hypothetical protein